MKKFSRLFARIIIPALLIAILILIFFKSVDRTPGINPGAIAENVPVVVFSDEPESFPALLEPYSDIPSLLPQKQIVSTKPLIDKLLADYHIKSVVWLYEDVANNNFAVLVSGKIHPKAKNKGISNNSASGNDGSFTIGNNSWYCSIVGRFTLFSEDKDALSFFSEMIPKGQEIHQGRQNPNKYSGNKIFTKKITAAIPEFNENETMIFNVNEYNNQLFLSGMHDKPSQSIEKSIPVSGGLSKQKPLSGNNNCYYRYNNAGEDLLISIILSSDAISEIHATTEVLAYNDNTDAFALLQNQIKRGPFLVDNHKTGSKSIIAFDIDNTMYLFNDKGELQWQKQFPDDIVGNVEQVDKFNNGRHQFIWNSQEKIHLIDINGNEVDGYPFIIPGKTTKGVSLVHFKGYTYPNILLINSEGKVLNVNLTPTLVPEWKVTKTNFNVSEPIKYLNSGSDHYVIVAGDNGEVLMLNKTGDVRLRIKNSFTNNSLSDFYFNETNSKGNLITTDNTGTLIYIPKKGAVAKTVFGTFSSNHFFHYKDFDGDGNNDFIYVDKNIISVFNRFKKVIFTRELKYNVMIKPSIIKINDHNAICIIDSNNSELNIFTKNGSKQNEKIPCEEHYVYHQENSVIYSALGRKIYRVKL